MSGQVLPTNQTLQSGIEAPQAPAKKAIAVSGLMAVMLAISENIPSLQGLSTVLLKASALLTTLNGSFTKDWLAIISTGPNSDEEQIQEAQKISNVDQRADELSLLSAQYQRHNLEYQQTQSFWTALTDATQQGSSSVANAMNTVIDFGGAITTTASDLTNILA